ncbi:RHS repeat domain-containing protein [Ulvibacterium marinum]|uniref:RHS repeat domain-containing protein n=1 Tax=Ulvibacterium marinum TaxID=2419782 RepID=UPI002493E7F2|nr:RHS repeat-associated core domain-containing protein [Ulvibacterium marinum]
MTTDYTGNFVYEGGNLQFLNHPEGYIEPDGSGGYDYIYQCKDHLGNIRLSFADDNGDGSVATSEIREENNYYPFGLKHMGYKGVVNGRNHKYGYGGKEEQDELDLAWLDITARNYDPALGRWMNIDPLAEKMRRYSPYNYAFDNPVFYIDPDGMEAYASNGYQKLDYNEARAQGVSSTGGGGTVDISNTDSSGNTIKVSMSSSEASEAIMGDTESVDNLNLDFGNEENNLESMISSQAPPDFLEKMRNWLLYGEWLNNTDFDNKYSESVSIYFWEKTSDEDVGHTAIEIDGVVYGYYPTDLNGNGGYDKDDLNNSPGDLHVDDQASFRRTYRGDTIDAFVLKVTPTQKSNLLNNLSAIRNNPGTYGLFGNHCTSVASSCLSNSGIRILDNPNQTGSIGAPGLSPNEYKSIINNGHNGRIIRRNNSFTVR